MSKGGGSQSTTPWKGVQPYMTQGYKYAQNQLQNPPEYYPGQTWVGPLPQEQQGFQSQANFLGSVFGQTPQLDQSLPTAPTYAGSPAGSAGTGKGGATAAPQTGTTQTGGTGKGGAAPQSTPQPMSGGTAPQYGQLVGTGSNLMAGGPTAGATGALGGLTQQNLASMFGGPTNMVNDPGNMYAGLQAPSFNWQGGDLMAGVNPAQINTSGIGNVGYNPSAYTPGMDPNVQASMNQMMSGQGDYSQVDAVTQAASRNMMRNFQEEILPALTSRTNLLNNNTGAIKDLNRIIPQMEQSIGDIAANTAWQERMRASQAQQFGTQLGANTGLQSYGLGLQGAGTRAGLDQATQQLLGGLAGQQAGLDQSYASLLANQNLAGNQMGLQAAQYGSGLGMDWNRLLANQNLGAGQLGLQADLGQQGVIDQYRQQALGLGGLYGNLAGQTSQNMQAGANLFPSTMQMGLMPSMFQQQYAQGYLRPFAEQALQGDIGRWDWQQNMPLDLGNWYSGMISGVGGTNYGRTNTTQGSGQTMTDLANTGMNAYMLYKMMSDREAKEDIQPAGGVLEKLRRLPIYRWRYRGDATPHMGPMAQDFRDVFGVGDGKTIAVVDVVGVVLGALQELAERPA